jgi:beta-glucuronidase
MDVYFFTGLIAVIPALLKMINYRRRIHGVYDMYGNPKPSMKVLRELSSPMEVQQMRQW